MRNSRYYLNVSIEERAKRRHASQNSTNRSYDEAILADMRQRDIADATREASPMRAADDAITITTDGLELAEVVACVKQHALIPVN